MPRRHVPPALKERIPDLHLRHGYSVKEICTILAVQKSLVYKTLEYHRLHGVTFNPLAGPRGRPRSLSSEDTKFIRSLIAQRPTIYLDELQSRLAETRHVEISISSLSRALRRLHYTRKAVSKRALERDIILRAAYMNRVGEIVPDPEMLMFTDESARDGRTSGRRMGWSLSGTRCVSRRVFVRGKRYSILPVLTLDGIITYDIVEGSVTADRFERFLREFLVCIPS